MSGVRVPWFSAPGWTRVKGALLMLAAVLAGIGIAAAGHGDVLIGGILVMAAGGAMFIAGVFVGHDIGQPEAENSHPGSDA